MRFQISMPMVNSVVRPLTFPDPSDLASIRPGYEEAIAAELDAIFEAIPHEDLAIQWDCAWEVAAVYDGLAGYPSESEIETHAAPIGRLSTEASRTRSRSAFISASARSAAGRASRRKISAARSNWSTHRSRRPAGASTGCISRRSTTPTTNSTRRSPGSKVGGARVYLGLIHSMASFKARLAVARKYLPDFGLAAYCGFGRTRPRKCRRCSRIISPRSRSRALSDR